MERTGKNIIDVIHKDFMVRINLNNAINALDFSRYIMHTNDFTFRYISFYFFYCLYFITFCLTLKSAHKGKART